MSKITETRLTLAALIYGVEIDLKNSIKKNITPFFKDLSFLKNNELEKKVIDRYERDNAGSKWKQNLDEVIEFLDFQDTFIVLHQNNEFLGKESSKLSQKEFRNLK